ncbi:hypothetical protein E4U30_004576 [Claviceps sp. LM220 group G6]|nr:hypothetical protein E4U30_004576 [Claviceps sp. LM220 group G6]
MRFDYLNKGPAWAPVHEINVGELTPHPIGDSAWLANGYLVIGSGNQLIVKDRRIDGGQSAITCVNHVDNAVSDDLFDAVQKLNGPLPVFHPQFISQCILAGKWDLSRNIMLALYRTLKYIVPGDAVDDYLGIHVSSFYLSSVPLDDETNTIRELATVTTDGEDDDFLTERVAASTNDKLSKVRLPQLSGHEQIQLADMIECVASVESHRRSMDENGARFMLFFRQHALRKGRPSQMQLSWREFNWAFHSSSQDILLDFVSRHNQGSMRWEQARETGVFMWLSDATALRNQFEIMAKNEYTNSELKDPVECSLFYLALRNKTMLQRLWRIASWNKEQTATQKLLANDFCDPRWQRTALKNAYALLSKRRFQDAVGVCLRQLNDLQLAIAISRIYEGDEGPVIQKIIHDEVLSLAAQEDNRWLASWAFWMLDRRDMAVKALLNAIIDCGSTRNSRGVWSHSESSGRATDNIIQNVPLCAPHPSPAAGLNIPSILGRPKLAAQTPVPPTPAPWPISCDSHTRCAEWSRMSWHTPNEYLKEQTASADSAPKEPATEKELTTSSGARLAYARSLTLRKPATPKGTSSPGGLSTRRADNSEEASHLEWRTPSRGAMSPGRGVGIRSRYVQDRVTANYRRRIRIVYVFAE